MTTMGLSSTEAFTLLDVLPTEGEFPVVKRTRYGVWVRIETSFVFLPNEVLTEESDSDDIAPPEGNYGE